ATVDFAFSAQSCTVQMYENIWYDSCQLVHDKVTPASDELPIVDGTTSARISTSYSRGDHIHPLQISSIIPTKDTATGEEGAANSYARSDHTHHVNLNNDVPLKDTGTGSAGATSIYANATYQNPFNVDPTVANVPLVNATAATNGSSDYYCRNDHVHPQQLLYDGNITATKFIKTGRTDNEMLLGDGTTKKVVIAQNSYNIYGTEKIYKIMLICYLQLHKQFFC
ncbi:MAG: hypothetical protein EZS28_049573, partial [Streblomastix strix]